MFFSVIVVMCLLVTN